MLTLEEIKKATPETLKKELGKARTEKAQIVLKVRMSQSKANHEVKMWKKYIARILTELNSEKPKALRSKEIEKNTLAK